MSISAFGKKLVEAAKQISSGATPLRSPHRPVRFDHRFAMYPFNIEWRRSNLNCIGDRLPALVAVPYWMTITLRQRKIKAIAER
ncbi:MULTISPECIES: hypothetical protein [Sphingomonadaceae]|uniref:hypothetical protein n=1 Tax=Sphingomonadales TaxID=204457 RepID=UPI000826638B|nr:MULTISPECIES: hypothetical protein [Sphingomonadaceae]